MPTWDERFRRGDYPQDPDPATLLERWVDRFPDGRALDLAAGTGRNAVFLAEHGYEVDAVDRSRAGLEIAMENARRRGVADRINPIRADLTEYAFPNDAYDVVTVSFYRAVDRLPDVRDAMAPGGMLFVEHHLRTTDEVDLGPSGDRYRFAANELLRVCLDMTVLRYEAGRERRGSDGAVGATARIVARNSTGQRQSYPFVPAPRQ